MPNTDPADKLRRIHDRIVATIHAGDKAELRKARRCYRRALAQAAKVARWRRLNGFSV